MKSQSSPSNISSIFYFPKQKYSYAAFGESKVTKRFSNGKNDSAITSITDSPVKIIYNIRLCSAFDFFIAIIELATKIHPIINLIIIYILLCSPCYYAYDGDGTYCPVVVKRYTATNAHPLALTFV